jgi:hypothetical protein
MAEIEKRTPKVGMRFRDSEEAWEFWVDYGGHVGFDVRKRSTITDLLSLLRGCMENYSLRRSAW